MDNRSSMEWYDYQIESDTSARQTARQLLGPELSAFADAMAAMADCLDFAVASGQEDLVERYKIAIAVQGFNHLCSAWDNTLTGRFDAAFSQGRMILESSDFLVALVGRPGLASDIENGKVKVEAALRATRDHLNKQSAGSGSDWFAERKSKSNPLHHFAHLSSYSVKSGWATQEDERGLHAYIRPGGVTTLRTLRKTAILVAMFANAFLWAVVYGFQTNANINSYWRDQGEAMLEAHIESLNREGDELASTGALDSLTIQSGWARDDKTQTR